MFVGHLAVALAARRASPPTPLAALVAATFALDLLWPVLLLAGVERVRIAPGTTAFTPLDFEHYPWSHSLSMAVIWGVVAGRLAVIPLKHAGSGLAIGLVVVSHWLLDVLAHRPDLPLWPGGPRMGFGLWQSIPGTLLVEGALFAAAVVIYARGTRARRASGVWAFWSLMLCTTAIWIAGPWGPPPPGEGAVAGVALALWLLVVWAAWIDRTREDTPRDGSP
ncbi:MAG: hypothetical protein A3I61_07495 [Acidobacteria bacterium RIFCSPLOWO2_02_FULL_68_18]|nr:MAG: hypothetical protein A3I61_07495 [Acidobacteria bacterium RIFCSPLOWO2_02_FULL_68_18]OFW50935.1 MAG: hypothetical protein A3G77_15010 [Acidobacteria bacterium RIFCSPLOWO2_12_FULL_68_19]